MKRLFTTFLCQLALVALWAAPADPFPVDVTQPDGTQLTIVQHGDEDFHYVTTLDGVLLCQVGSAYYIAQTDALGHVSATTLLAHNAGYRNEAELAGIARQDMVKFRAQAEREQGARRVMREPVITTQYEFPHTGSPKAVVILVEFADSTFTISDPRRSFNQYLNGEGDPEEFGFGEHNNYESVRDYFKSASFGQFTPQFDVYGPVTLSSPLKTYGGTSATGDGEDMNKLLREACQMMDDSLDFSQYDSNGDGYADLVVVIYAGYSQAVNGNSNECIWPKSGYTAGGTYDGVSVYRYAVSAELNGFPNCYSREPFKRINGIGVFCHEFSHCLGLPDLYPTKSSVKGDNQAMEFWSLMDSGCYLINGTAPVAYTAWEREALGWFDIETLTEDGEYAITPIDEGGKAYRILNDNDATQHEYFVVENIQDRGVNIRQKGHGLLVTHVNYNETAFALSSNSVNNIKGQPRMTVVPADGLLFAQYNIDGVHYKNQDFYDELAGDPYPGTSNVTALNDTTGIVNFQVYTGERLNKALADISESEDGTVTFRFISDFSQELGINDLPAARQAASQLVYSLDGRRMGTSYADLPKGIYIKDGKKVVKR